MNSLALVLAVIQPLWPSKDQIPNFQPHQIAAMTDEVKAEGFVASEHVMPYLDWFEPPEKPNGGCVILISGGSYQHLCDVGLVRKVWYEKFREAGFQCVNLVYRSPRSNIGEYYRTAWQDGQRAVRLVRAAAKERGFNPENIGTMSMSAGSHLNVLLATSSETRAYDYVSDPDEEPCHINWAVVGAVAYGLSDGVGLPNSRLGSGSDIKLDPAFKFDEKTCPMCFLHGGDDPFSPNASSMIYRQLRRMKVPAELHIYADRAHGGFWVDNWWESVSGFLRQMNFDGKLGEEVLLMDRCAAINPAVRYFKEDIWPEGKMPDRQANQCIPYLEWYIPTNLTTKAIQIVYSGGGYYYNHPERFEVVPTRKFLNEKGMTVVTMKYRTPRPLNLEKHISAWQDLQRAIRIVRRDAASYGLDGNRIGILGQSAGGHLTLMGATSSRQLAYWPIDELDKTPCNVQWGVAFYPAYAMNDGIDVPNVNGGNGDDARLVDEFNFDLYTPPMLFLHGDADSWAAMNSVKAWERMRMMGIQSELHTYAKRGHCFQRAAAPGTGSYTHLNRVWEFLTKKGFNK